MTKPKAPSPFLPAFGAAAPLADTRLQMVLRQTGFDPGAPQAPAPKPQPRPQAMAKPAPSPSAELALKRRDWLMTVIERQRGLSAVAGGIPRVRDLSSQGFLDHYYAPGRPVIIEGAIADWPAVKRWTPDYLARTIGSAPVEYQRSRAGNADFELMKDRHRATIPFDRFIAEIATKDGNDAYITAYNSAANARAFAPLDSDMRPLTEYLADGQGMLWVGPADTFTPLHFDLTNNLLIQVVGAKRITLLPPSETPLIAHHRHVFSDVHDIGDSDCLVRHPAARKARRYEVTLAAGDMLYIPIGWWHQVRGLEFSVMLTATHFRWPNDGHAEYPG